MLSRKNSSKSKTEVDLKSDGKLHQAPLTAAGSPSDSSVVASAEMTETQPLQLQSEICGRSSNESAISHDGDCPIRVSASLKLSQAASDTCQALNDPLRTNKSSDSEGAAILEMASPVTEEDSSDISISDLSATSVDASLISQDIFKFTPELFPLIDITQGDIDSIVKRVEGGIANIKDIYALSPLQDGILFHSIMAIKGDPYLIATTMSFSGRDILDQYLVALQKVIGRHDIYRTAFVWEGLSKPVQVVLRHAPLPIDEVSLDPANGPVSEQLAARFDSREFRINLTQAPLIRVAIAQESDGRWILLQLVHHMIDDQHTRIQLQNEIQTLLEGRSERLNEPQPFSDFIAQTRLGSDTNEHKLYFSKVLADIDTPAIPFGLSEVGHGDLGVIQSQIMLPQELNDRLRSHADRMKVSVARICHLAWAVTIARVSGQECVVFGTVISLRQYAGPCGSAMGPLINTLPIRVDVGETSVEESLYNIKTNISTLIEHKHAPLTLAQRCSGVPSGTPLITSLLNFRRSPTKTNDGTNITHMEILKLQERTTYPISMNIDDSGIDLELTCQVIHHIDASRICGYMEQSLQSIVEALDHTPKMQVRDIEVLPTSERNMLLKSWNNTVISHEHRCIHQIFEDQVIQSPDAIAIVFEDQQMTYHELNVRANSLAHHLIDLGVKPDTLVGICVDRSLAMIVGLLAILKAGGAYVPLDPMFASERLNDILEDASPSILLADESGIKALGSSIPDPIVVVDPNTVFKNPTTNPHVTELSSHHLAYVIYTSGSTGKPKGVMIEHQSVTDLAMSRPLVFGVGPTSRVLQFFSLSFDASIHEIWSALSFGGSLHILPNQIRQDLPMLWKYLELKSITHAAFTPTSLQQYKDLRPLSIPLVIILGGEASPLSLLKALQELNPNGSIFNDYGPTETTVAATAWRCPRVFNGEVAPIGMPHSNKRIYVLDSYRKLVPIGAIGELYISGAGVARGYLNRPDLTDKVFIPDPFSEDGKSRMYKTGDLVRYLPDGNLVYMGRGDNQVKIRGYRIELGEIEARLYEHSIVREAVVLAIGDGSSKRLVAYVVADPTEGLAHTLRSHVSTKLPEYMVPVAFVRLDSLPLTPNGKLDRRALPEPDINSFVSQEYEAPQSEVECILASIWSDILKIDRIGRHDNFFMLGGHSLVAIQMIERLRQTGFQLSVRALFQTPTLSELAHSLSESKAITEVPNNLITYDTRRITPELLPLIDLTQADIDVIVDHFNGEISNIQDIYALSPLQDGILFHHIMATKGDPYLLFMTISFDNKTILDQYLDAMQKVIDRHDILRTAIVWEGLSTPAQVVLRHAQLSVVELSLSRTNGPIVDQIVKTIDPRQHRIDLTQAPLTRLVIAQDDGDSWIAVQLMHHIIGDHSTLDIMTDEIHMIMEHQEDKLPKPQPFRNLVSQVRSVSDDDSHNHFFSKMLTEIDTSTLPYGLSDVHSDGFDIMESYVTLPQDLNNRLRGHAKRMGVSLASMCHLAWAQVISKTSGQERVVFGTVLFGRMQGGSGSDRAMGLFINTLPLRVDVGETSVEESVRQTHDDLASLLEHEHASLAQAQRCSSIPAGTPLFSAMLNYRHNNTPSTDISSKGGWSIVEARERTNYPFVISVEDGGTTLGLTAQVVKLYDSFSICGYMQQSLQSLVEALDNTPKMQVRDLEIMPTMEREMLLRSWNNTVSSHEHRCIHQIFEDQVIQSPDAIAIVFEDQQMTYHELNVRANSLAHHLIDLGVKPDTLVGICVDRSLAMIVGLLAILKSGGAYVPLDPMFASERLNDILEDASPSILLADESGIKALDSSIPDSIVVVDPNTTFKDSTINPHVTELLSHHLAYVIYTSGSTGKPKGVMVEHAQVTRLFGTTSACFNFKKSDVWIMTHTFSFDFSVWEIWGALCYSGKLLIPSYRTTQSSEELYQLVCDHRVTVLNTTPSAFRPLIAIQEGPRPRDELRYVIFGGEALEPAMLKSWYATRPQSSPQMINMYGITETTVHATVHKVCMRDCDSAVSPIGVKLPDLTTYVLDARGQPVPLGAIGELCIGGAGVSRGYLNRAQLTSEKFPLDPFSETKGTRMYKTGDLVRYLPDGNLVYLGRNDLQVKIRGYRIELGEIEARLYEHSIVREAVVLAIGDGSSKRLVAYVVADPTEGLAHTLRSHVSTKLPEYMVPVAFVRLDSLPLTPNGKLDRRALPEPDINSFVSQEYEAPQSEVECILASIWSDILKIDRIGRHDNFFMLGGHSLVAIQMIERLRQTGLQLSVRALFQTPTLSELAHSLSESKAITEVPNNLITYDTRRITPELLPLIDLTQADIDVIVDHFNGEISNIQDIYALSPLQDGILFHHIMATKGDPYLLFVSMSFDNKIILDQYLDAMQKVIDRHDILRTAIMWEGLSTPAQVVLRHVQLSVVELSLSRTDGPIVDQIVKTIDPRQHRIDLTHAPLTRFVIAQDDGDWIAVQLIHHIINDHSTLDTMTNEIHMIMEHQENKLSKPQPFRNLVSQVRSVSDDDSHNRFFSKMLAEIDTPTLPYGLSDVHSDGFDVMESHVMLPQDLNNRLRGHAKRMGVSLASMCHLAWAQVVSKTSGQERVVFGTVLFGRMQGGSGSDRAMGLFINTLPLRVDVGETPVEESVQQTHDDLASLLEHEHASLAQAQRCSSIPAGTPLFSAILNYRHNDTPSSEISSKGGWSVIEGRERTNYPFVISVEDGGTTLGLTAQVVKLYDSSSICGYMQQSLQSLVEALDNTPKIQVRDLEIMPTMEREMLLRSWNNTVSSHEHRCIHQIFEDQVIQSPDAIAIVFEDQQMTYHELNVRANSLAHHLTDLGVKPDSLVGICVDRSLAMIVGLLAILKSGGAYVPLDPMFASERLNDILEDASPSILLADESGVKALGSSIPDSTVVVDPNATFKDPTTNPYVTELSSHHLAYVIYTSGSTGKPKGVMIEHQSVTNLAMSRPLVFGVGPTSRVLQFFSLSFDASIHEIWSALSFGGSLYILPNQIRQDLPMLWRYLELQSITHAILTPTSLLQHKDLRPLSTPLVIVLGGETLPLSLLKALQVLNPNGSIINDYGPTEVTVDAIAWECPQEFNGEVAPIGMPHSNKRIYVLDSYRRLIPIGAIGELYISGAGVARGYLNRPDLTDKAFLPDPFSEDGKSRMYKTGDLVRYLADGNLIYVGRSDNQVKIRGYRIELGEIEARLYEHSIVREAVVVAIGDESSKRLVAYVVADPTEGLAHTLRSHVSTKLPEYMVPAAFVRLDSLPLTPNGKLDRRALPEPDMDSFVSQEYETPQSEIECTLASIWSDILKIDRIGRHDNFFMLGGHSLVAIQMIERLRQTGLKLSVRALFQTPTLSELAHSLSESHAIIEAPKNLIACDTRKINPELLPLIDLTQADIDVIVDHFNGEISNIQDIYALSPLQDGILFHHIMATKGDPYLLFVSMSFDNKIILDQYLDAMQKVIDRHDILRTAIVWEGLSTPAQVVLRHAQLSVVELSLSRTDGPIVDQIVKTIDPRQHRIDLTHAPLTRFVIAQDDGDSWIAVQLIHHIIGDHSTLDTMSNEISMIMKHQEDKLSKPQPFRNLISQVRSVSDDDSHNHFFSKMLAEIDTPTLPYGLSDVHSDGFDVMESHVMLPQDLNNRLRGHAKRMGVSLASMCHLAWAQVISKTSGQERVVFGTVLFGRMQGGSGSDRAMGLFINTLPLRVDVGEISVEESVRQTHDDLASLLEHEHASLAQAQRCSSIPAGTPLFTAVLNYRNHMGRSSQSSGIVGAKFLDLQQRTNYPFAMSVDDLGIDMSLTCQATSSVDVSRICGYMQQSLQSLVEALDNTPKIQVRDLEIMPTMEREMLLRSWNNTVSSHEHRCIHQIFEDQVIQSPDAIAIVFEDQQMTYHELNVRANSLAHHLTDLGVKPDSLVGICVDRSLAMIVGLLAILKSGGAYVPLDPMFASERLNDILEDASPSILLADESGVKALGSSIPDSTVVVDPNATFKDPTTNPYVTELSSHHLAYVIYTSGSTGKPKGVMIEHQSVTNLAMSRPLVFGVGPTSRVLQFFSLSFDASIHEIWSALSFGGSLYILPNQIRQDLPMLWRYLELQSITHAILTPTSLLQHKDLRPLSTPLVIVLGGETLPLSLLKALQVLNPNGSIINDYGPTEVTVDAIAWECPQEFNGEVAPIGMPHSNKRIYVLDSYRRLIPIGAIGELYISGAGVARGYLNRPDLTDKAFLPDPFSEDGKSRMYKTGDLVRYLADGNLIYVGRSDNQVKIRGYRIELGEIEARLYEHSIVREAVVVAIGDESSKRLVAYVVADPTEGLALTLRSHVSTKLPEYMVPAAFVRLDSLPLTPNGKLDRRALPEPDMDSFVSQEYEAPQSEIECTLASIWSDILKIDRIGRHDNFFMLGGHSLVAIQMIERLRQTGLQLSVRALFQTPTLCELAHSLSESKAVTEAPKNLITYDTQRITPELLPLIDLTQDDIDVIVDHFNGEISNIQDIYALSPLQDGILFHHIMATKGDPYLLFVSMSFDNKTILDQYLDAMQKVIDRHDILRTAIMWEGLSTPAQVVLRHVQLSVVELSLSRTDGPIVDQIVKTIDPRQHRIDLTHAPLTRFVIAQDDGDSWIAVQLIHHIIGDHSTLDTMSNEISMIMEHQEDKLSKPQPFRNLVSQVRSVSDDDSHNHFFSKMLAEIDTPTLPYGLSDVHSDGFDVMESHLTLPQELNNRLRGHAKRMGVSLASMCHLAWAQVISKTSGQERVVFGTVLFGRMQGGSGSDRAMGLFINTLPLRVDVGETPVEESVQQTHDDLASLLEHEHASLAQAQRCSSIPAGTPLFSAILNYRHNDTPSSEISSKGGWSVIEGRERTNYPFVISVEDGGTTLGLTAQVVKLYDSSSICGYMQQSLQSLVEALDNTPKIQVRDLEIMPTMEREMLLRSWNNTVSSHEHRCIHQIFEDQVIQSPDAIAIVFEDQQMTYHELNVRANSLAHHLIDLGVKPDSLVGICVDRSLAMIVGLLAILKSGGAYVPLDPMFASERLNDILEDASPSILLADESGVKALGSSIPDSTVVVDPNATFKDPTTNPYVTELSSHHLAYVIYTSGSTGKPKGVMIEHQSVTNLAMSRPLVFGVGPTSRVLQFFSLSFDGSVHEIWSALSFGGSLYILPNQIRQDLSMLWTYLGLQSITHAILTPTLLQQHKDLRPLSTPLVIVLGGETLPLSLLKALQLLNPNGSIINDYGPTEVTVDAIAWECPQEFNGEVAPIGVPHSNKRIYVLDSYRKLAPIGAIGELYISGAGVARGYLNRPDLTDKVFISDPFSEDGKSRMYKTGDLVRYLPDGNLVYLGRNDHQVKIRGYRIELGEIEARLYEHSIVREAVVVAIGDGSSKRLIAYVVADPTEGLTHTLRSQVSTKLPEYMVPAAFVRLDSLPLTPNGKLDHRVLPEPDMDSFVSQEYEAPQSEIEYTLASIWSDILKINRIGRHDNFFMLGGHSLLAIKMINQIRSRLGTSASLHALFRYPTLAEFALRILQGGAIDKNALDVLLPLKPQGNRPPLFCIHSGVGLGWSYIALSKYLHSDQPIYALQARGMGKSAPLAASIEEMALDYVDQIRSVQPQGPYHLLGWSLGGTIAQCMAVQLERMGEGIALLAMMDTLPEMSMLIYKRQADVDDDTNIVKYLGIEDSLEGKVLLHQAQHVSKNNTDIFNRYSPSVYSGDMIFFWATHFTHLDPRSWALFTLGTLEVHEVECKHEDMDKAENLAVVGRVLAKKFEELHEAKMFREQ